MAKRIEVGPHGDGRWHRKTQGASRAGSVHDTKAEAERLGREQAKRERAEFVIRGRDGRIQDADSYGNDPHPPKDKKH